MILKFHLSIEDFSTGAIGNGRQGDGFARPMADARTRGASPGVNDLARLCGASGLDPIWTALRTSIETQSRNWPPAIACTRLYANSNSGNGILRPETFDRARRHEPRRRSKRLSRPTAAAASRRNIMLFCGVGSHVGARRLPGGGRSPTETSAFLGTILWRAPRITGTWLTFA
jgi:hypothetical protein